MRRTQREVAGRRARRERRSVDLLFFFFSPQDSEAGFESKSKERKEKKKGDASLREAGERKGHKSTAKFTRRGLPSGKKQERNISVQMRLREGVGGR
jgi:hypothetical protein